jgi:hypothetical protein
VSVRRRLTALSSLALASILAAAAFGAASAAAATPGEVTTYEIGKANRAARTVRVSLACGGSAGACAGTARLSLQIPKHSPALPAGVSEKPPFPFAEAAYSVAAESQSTVTIAVPAKTFALARRYRPRHTPNGWGWA